MKLVKNHHKENMWLYIYMAIIVGVLLYFFFN